MAMTLIIMKRKTLYFWSIVGTFLLSAFSVKNAYFPEITSEDIEKECGNGFWIRDSSRNIEIIRCYNRETMEFISAYSVSGERIKRRAF